MKRIKKELIDVVIVLSFYIGLGIAWLYCIIRMTTDRGIR